MSEYTQLEISNIFHCIAIAYGKDLEFEELFDYVKFKNYKELEKAFHSDRTILMRMEGAASLLNYTNEQKVFDGFLSNLRVIVEAFR